jgi:hypothetical protein
MNLRLWGSCRFRKCVSVENLEKRQKKERLKKEKVGLLGSEYPVNPKMHVICVFVEIFDQNAFLNRHDPRSFSGIIGLVKLVRFCLR